MSGASKRFPAGTPPWLLALFKAGRELATIVEEDVQSCGNAPPHSDDCADCRRERKAILRWARAVLGAREVHSNAR